MPEQAPAEANLTRHEPHVNASETGGRDIGDLVRETRTETFVSIERYHPGRVVGQNKSLQRPVALGSEVRELVVPDFCSTRPR
jgi:hypothetical protein